MGQLKEEKQEKIAWNFYFSVALLVLSFVVTLFYLPPFFIVLEAVLLSLAIFLFILPSLSPRQEKLPEQSDLNFGGENLRAVLERLDDALFVYDSDFRIKFWNPAAEFLFNIKREEAMDRILTPQDAENPHLGLLAQVAFPSLAPGMVARSPAGAPTQVMDLSFNDPFREFRVTSFTLGFGPDGAPLGFAKVVRDHTREMSLIKSKSEFVTIASHQLRTPVTGIHWALELLHNDQKLDPSMKPLVDGAFEASETLLKIIDDLLGIAKIEEGRFGYSFGEVDIIAFLEKLLAQILPVAEHAGISIYFDKPADKLPSVVADPQKLAMAVSNLIENAMRYNVQNGSVTVSVARASEGPFVELVIKDTGIGIPAGGMSKLFTKFFRAENALKQQTEGSGLGLYIVKNIIQEHGGNIWAESEVGRGTAMHLTLSTDKDRVPKHEVPLG